MIEPAKRPIEDLVNSDARYLVDVDPIEGCNRGTYKFNAQLDEYVILPVVEGYEGVMPDFFEDRLSDFFSNIAEIRNLSNAMLQLNWEATLNTLGQFLTNRTFGLGGIFDHATPLGLLQQTEDWPNARRLRTEPRRLSYAAGHEYLGRVITFFVR